MNQSKIYLMLIIAFACVLVVPLCVQAEAKTHTTSEAAPSKIVDLNKANAGDLASVPGIGPKIADRILDYRNKNGKFKSKEEIMNVKGIGQKKYEKIKNYITVEKTS
jgi:competence protein ComEA